MYSRINMVGIFLLGTLALTVSVSDITAQEEIENLVQNPEFDAGIAGWNVQSLDNGAFAELEVERNGGVVGDCVVFQVESVGTNDYEPEIHSSEFMVEEGKTYTIAFWAKTDEGETRPFDICLEAFPDGVNWDGFCQSPTMTDEWKEYWITGTPGFSSSAWVHFTPKRVEGYIWLDHFRVYEGQYEPEEELQKLMGKPKAVTPVDSLATVWGKIKSR